MVGNTRESRMTAGALTHSGHQAFMCLLRSTRSMGIMNTVAHTPEPSDTLLVEHLPAPRPSLRLAVVTETYPPEINGVARTLARLVRGVQARGHDVQLIRPRQAPDRLQATLQTPLEQVLVRGLPIPQYPHLRMGLPAKSALVKQWTLHRPDLVHIATQGPLGWSALQAARKLRLPICTDFRTNFDAYSRHYGMAWLQKPIAAYLRKFHNLADCTTVPTEALRAALAANRFERLQVIARGVDVAAFNPSFRDAELRARWGAGEHDTVALYVGRLAAEKNLGLLASAFQAMRVANPRLRLVVVGDGPARGDLQARCPDAQFAGSLSGHALARHYASADCFIFPSLTETYGNVTPEALASGLAVLAYDHAAAGDLIQSGRNGLLAPAGDEATFMRLAQQLASDPALVRQLRQHASASVAERDWGLIAAQVESVWMSLLAQHAGSHRAVFAGVRAQAA
jgi:glycosyltransferase involved in cell wall biosynthesis